MGNSSKRRAWLSMNPSIQPFNMISEECGYPDFSNRDGFEYYLSKHSFGFI